MTEIVVGPDGNVRMIYADDLAPLAESLGAPTTRRASDVEPCGTGWQADMRRVGGPILLAGGVPFVRRSDALEAEVEWLREHGLPVPIA